MTVARKVARMVEWWVVKMIGELAAMKVVQMVEWMVVPKVVRSE